MAAYVFVNITAGHFKVWGYDFFSSDNGGQVITYWGRIGLPMQHLTKNNKHFENSGDGFDYCRKKCDEKFCKQYKAIPNWLYFSLIETATGIAKLIKIIKQMGEVQYYEPPQKRKTA